MLADLFGVELATHLTQLSDNITIDAIVPVPLHSIRLRERGYNQAELLTKSISKQSGIPIHADALFRRKYTKTQTQMNNIERIHNVQNAFGTKQSNMIAGKCWLLVDDVMTTGSTLNACAHVLMNNGALSVYTLTIARA